MEAKYLKIHYVWVAWFMDVRELIAKVNQMNIHPTCSFHRWAIAFHINYSDVHIAFDEPNMDGDCLFNDTTHSRRQSNTLDHTHSRTHLFVFQWLKMTHAHAQRMKRASTYLSTPPVSIDIILLLCRFFSPPARANVLATVPSNCYRSPYNSDRQWKVAEFSSFHYSPMILE